MIDPATLPSGTARPTLAELGPLASAALRRYGIHAASLQSLRYYHNATYRVAASDGQQFVLRVTSAAQSEARLRSEMLWLRAMQATAAVCVPVPVAALDGELLVHASVPTLPEPRWCNLFRWLDGTHIAEEELEAIHFDAMGSACAHLHAESVKFKPPPAFDRPDWGEKHGLEPGVVHAFERIASHWQRHFPNVAADGFSRHAGQARELLRQLRTDPRSCGLIHADFHPGNCLFRPGRVAIVDFEDLGAGHFLYDMASALFGSLERHDYPRLADAFTTAYARIRPLPSDFAHQLRLFQLLRAVFLTHLVLPQGELDGNPWWTGFLLGKLRRLLDSPSGPP